MFKYQTMLAKFIDLSGSLDERLVFAGPNVTGTMPKLPIMKTEVADDGMPSAYSEEAIAAAALGDEYILWSGISVS